MTDPLVSIVTPSYNQGKYIEETIISVIKQDYAPLEYIVMDGGSTDNTMAILPRYGDRLKWMSENDTGPEDAVNKGFALSSGEILGWLASDDTYLPGTLQKVVEYFLLNPEVAMIYGDSDYVDQSGNKILRYAAEPFDYEKFAIYNVIPQPSTFFRRDAFFDAGGLSTALKLETDYDLWLRIAQIGRIVYLPEVFSNYRLHMEAKTLGYHDQFLRYKECVAITAKYYGWVPANRVYPYVYSLLRKKLPFLTKCDRFLKLLSLFLSFFFYIKFNKGINLKDIKYVARNIKLFLAGWELADLMKSKFESKL